MFLWVISWGLSGVPASPCAHLLTREGFAQLHAHYSETHAPSDRDLVVAAFQSWLHKLAASVHRRLPKALGVPSLEDLEQQGYIGMLEAFESFDPTRKVTFQTYAAPRVRGKIIDYLRSLDWAPRLVRERSKEYQGAVRRLEVQGILRNPEAVRSELEKSRSPEAASRIMRDGGRPVLQQSMLRKSHNEGAELNVLDDVASRSSLGSRPLSEREESFEFLLKGLTHVERQVIEGLFQRGLRAEILALELRIKTNKVHFLRRQALAKMRGRLANEETTQQDR